jgi:hypothetical protein
MAEKPWSNLKYNIVLCLVFALMFGGAALGIGLAIYAAISPEFYFQLVFWEHRIGMIFVAVAIIGMGLLIGLICLNDFLAKRKRERDRRDRITEVMKLAGLDPRDPEARKKYEELSNYDLARAFEKLSAESAAADDSRRNGGDTSK